MASDPDFIPGLSTDLLSKVELCRTLKALYE
jgi:hypothetical protein